MLSRGLLVGALVLLRHAAALGVFESTDFGTPDLLGFYRERLHVPERYAAAAGSEVIAHFGDNFEFGLATAPAHVEDALHDAWLDFARAGRVVAFNNTARPEERTRFWTEPEAELDLAAGAGATIFRMGADWTRLFPDGAAEMDQAAWARYREIMLMCHERGMRVMLTLFHHSLPPWLGAVGGWTNSSSVRHFETFARAVLGAIGADEPLLRAVHSVITMNEPHVFAMLTYCAGLWPPGSEPSTFDSLRCFTPWGAYAVAMANMARGHRAAHEFVAQLGLRLRVGAAHHVPCYNAKTVLDRPTQRMSELLTTFHFQDLIANASDLCARAAPVRCAMVRGPIACVRAAGAVCAHAGCACNPRPYAHLASGLITTGRRSSTARRSRSSRRRSTPRQGAPSTPTASSACSSPLASGTLAFQSSSRRTGLPTPPTCSDQRTSSSTCSPCAPRSTWACPCAPTSFGRSLTTLNGRTGTAQSLGLSR